jgi:N-carbamoyl-L-amino-acid hydrolase
VKPTNLTFDAERLWTRLDMSARIGAIPGNGLCRLALTAEDQAMRDVFAGWVKAAGLSLTVDRLGSMWARLEGSAPDLPPVIIGSHLDTQAKGGRFDGILGVLAGLEVLQSLAESGFRPKRAIEVVNWTNEEGARFLPPMIASLVFAGGLDEAEARAKTDKAGTTLGAALDEIGWRGEAAATGKPIDSYFELHIEQGPKLDTLGCPVGIVTGGYAMSGRRIRVTGTTAHVGPTPMTHRSNALVGASAMALAVDEIGWRHAPEDGKSTAARLDLRPNLPGIISDEADLYIDYRHPDAERLKVMDAEVEAACAEASRRTRTRVEIAESWGFGGMTFDAGLVALLKDTAGRLAIPYIDMRSEAGHDAYNIAKVAPAVMIFTPCIGGITHNEAENIDRSMTLPGIRLLMDAVVARANR